MYENGSQLDTYDIYNYWQFRDYLSSLKYEMRI